MLNKPSKVSTIPFGYVVKNVTKSIDLGDRDSGAFSRYVAGEHMHTDDLHIREWGEIGDGYLGPAFHRVFRKGQVLYGSRRTYLRKVAVAHFDGVTANTTFVLEPKGKTLLPELLPFIMQSEGFVQHSILHSKGSTNPYESWGDLAKYEVHLPPLDEQRRIAEILWAADAMQNEYQGVGTCLETLLSAYLRSIFNKNNWELKAVSEVFEVQLGRMAAPKFRKGISTRPYLRNVNVQWGKIVLDDINEMDFTDDEMKKYALKKGDLLICEGGEVGRSAIWDGEIPDIAYQNALHRLRPVRNGLQPKLMMYFMRYASTSGLLARLTGQSTIAHLPAVKLKTLKVPVPEQNEQEKILDQIEELENSIQGAKSLFVNSKLLQTSLLNSLLRSI